MNPSKPRHYRHPSFSLKKRANERGSSMLEVLISVVVVSIGLLGMALLQATALKNNQSSYLRSQAVMLSYFMLESMRADRTNAIGGSYNMAKTCKTIESASGLVENNKQIWLQALKDNLGDSDSTCGYISCASNMCTVRIFWDDSRVTGGSADQSIETQTQL